MRLASTLPVLLLMISSVAGASTTLLTFSDNTTPQDPYPATLNNPSTGVPFTQAFGVGKEFRFISPFDGTIGANGEKDGIFGGGSETWSFDQNGNLTGTNGFPDNPGAANPAGSAAPVQMTNPLLLQPGFIAGQGFSFLAPA